MLGFIYMYIYIYACAYAYAYTCVFAYTYAHAYVHAHAHTHTSIYYLCQILFPEIICSAPPCILCNEYDEFFNTLSTVSTLHFAYVYFDIPFCSKNYNPRTVSTVKHQ